MKPRHKVSRAGVELVKAFEGYRQTAAQLADGRWTVGYGHTKTARRGSKVSEDDADLLLQYDLIEVAAAVNALTYTPLTQNQFDALVCFAFNVGEPAFRRSNVLKRVNEGAMLQAACALELWRKADFEGERIVVDALVRRRAAEKALFLTPTDGWIAAPSAVLPPRFDGDVGSAAPIGQPVDLTTSLTGESAAAVREPSAGLDAAAEQVAEAAAEPLASRPVSQITEVSQALSARLEAILRPVEPDEADEAVEPAAPPAEPVALATEPVIEPVAEPVAEVLAEPVAEAEMASSVEAVFAKEPASVPPTENAAVPGLFPQPIYREQAGPEPSQQTVGGGQRRKSGSSVGSYVFLALVGLGVFAVATTWAFGGRASGMGPRPILLGVPLAIAGIGLMAWAVYQLISKFGGRDD